MQMQCSIFHRLLKINIKYPYQNPNAEEASGLNKTMKDEMKIEMGRFFAPNIEKFIIGQILENENGKVSLLPQPHTNCPLCQ